MKPHTQSENSDAAMTRRTFLYQGAAVGAGVAVFVGGLAPGPFREGPRSQETTYDLSEVVP